MIPVIDVHAHIFSGRDIPLKGYLRTRHYPWILRWIIKVLIIPPVAYCVRKTLEPIKKKGIFYRIFCPVLQIVLTIFARQYKKWANTLSKPTDTVACKLVETYLHADIDLYVPLMLDYEYWFENSPDVPFTEQIRFFYEEIVVPYRGLFHPFIPFDPCRELAFRHRRCNPDDHLERTGSLALVKDAIENKGFIGVKLYNALGYRPTENDLPEVVENRQKIALHKKKYVFDGAEYDEVLSELYDYCVENDVPITTHCGMYGTEPYPGASFHFGQAVFWRKVLDQQKYKNLNLNLAHFGWYFKTGYEEPPSWIKDICGMLNDYDHLYTDVAHQRIVSRRYRRRITEDYKKIIRDFPIVKERLMFGIDWHVIIRVKHYERFKKEFIRALTNGNLLTAAELEAFLGGNALNFLKLHRGMSNWDRLDKFYKRHDITPPEWFGAV